MHILFVMQIYIKTFTHENFYKKICENVIEVDEKP